MITCRRIPGQRGQPRPTHRNRQARHRSSTGGLGVGKTASGCKFCALELLRQHAQGSDWFVATLGTDCGDMCQVLVRALRNEQVFLVDAEASARQCGQFVLHFAVAQRIHGFCKFQLQARADEIADRRAQRVPPRGRNQQVNASARTISGNLGDWFGEVIELRGRSADIVPPVHNQESLLLGFRHAVGLGVIAEQTRDFIHDAAQAFWLMTPSNPGHVRQPCEGF